MAKKKQTEESMDRPIDVIDNLAEKSLRIDQSKEEWLEYLREFRDELNIAIENVRDELDQ